MIANSYHLWCRGVPYVVNWCFDCTGWISLIDIDDQVEDTKSRFQILVYYFGATSSCYLPNVAKFCTLSDI